MATHDVAGAYAHCLAIARGHYENFPVASRLLPPRLRAPVAAIYAFARRADDLADEGDMDAVTRLTELDAMAASLDALRAAHQPSDPAFIALADAISRHALPLEPFYDLLTAFRMDVTTKHYATFAEVLNYCRYSANPVGRLLLHLYRSATPQNLEYSDAICSALQLINFLQDIAQDFDENGRIYLPEDEMRHYGVTGRHIAERRTDGAMRGLLDQQIERARDLLLSGAPLGNILPGRAGLELRLIVHGGLGVLDKLSQQKNDAFTRPRLNKGDWIRIFLKAITH